MQQTNKKNTGKFILPGLSTFHLPSISNFHIDDSLKFITTQKNIQNHSNHFLDQNHEHKHHHQEEDSLAIRLQKIEPQTSSGKKKRIGCTCKKTFCLKMYCQCFANSKTCNEDCVCCQCKNIEQNEEIIKKAKESIKEKGSSCSYMTEKRCNCKKSFCQKKYCECFNAGISCSQSCKCTQCYNKNQDIQKKKPSASIESKSQIQQSEKFLQQSMENIMKA